MSSNHRYNSIIKCNTNNIRGSMYNKTKRCLKSFMAMLLAFISAFSAIPQNIFASETSTTGSEPHSPYSAVETFTARIYGEEVKISSDGIAIINIAGFDEPIEVEVPRYIFLDGEAISIDDDRIENISPVLMSDLASSLNSPSAFADGPGDGEESVVDMPSIGFIASVRSSLPSNPVVGQIGQEYTHPAYVTMNGRSVSSIRYVVTINGVSYESFCADPNLPGPENSNAVYELAGVGSDAFRTVLRYGFPTNPALTEGLSGEDRSWNAYITRVAIAYVSRPNATWGGLTGVTGIVVNERVAGVGGAEAKANSPAITVNDEVSDSLFGFEELSPPFHLGHSRRTNCLRNPFRFVWVLGTPAGTRLYVDGSHVATAPANPTDIFTVNNPEEEFLAASSFHFVMPSGSEGLTARVDLVGINNQYSGRVFVMQNPSSPDSWQDIVFYVPEVLAHAEYTWDYEPSQEFGRLRITKRSAANGSTLAGAVFRITGPNGFDVTRTTLSNGMIELTHLAAGSYSITELSPPPNYRLSEPVTQTVTIAQGSDTWVTVNFVNPRNNDGGDGGTAPPPTIQSNTSVLIEKVDALSRENIPNASHPGSGALIRLQGMSSMTIVAGDGQSVTFNNAGVNLSQILTANANIAPSGIPGVTSTVGDGWWHLEGLPYGFYSVFEERAPDGFSLLPQHTSSSFWLHPPDVTIGLNVVETQVVIPWGDVLAILENLVGANTPAMDLQDVLNIMTSALGAVELVVIPVYDIGQSPHVNSVHKIFENYPFSEVVVYKRDRITNQGLADAQFRIEGFFVEGNAPQIIDMVGTTDDNGRLVFTGLPAGGYTITEVMPPPGYLLDQPNFQHVNVSWGQIDGHPTRPAPSLLFQNTPMSALEVLKIDGITGVPLSGAIFELVDPTTGEFWQVTSGVNGIATFGVATYDSTASSIGSLGNMLRPNHAFLLREIQAPLGYVLTEGMREVVLSPSADNRITWHNYRNPGLTIIKQDVRPDRA